MVHVFVRRITRWDEKHFLKTELLPCSFCYDKMTDVYWIERAAEYPYAFRHIYNMVQKAIEGNEHFDISPIEREREGPSYTVDTIRLLRTSLSHDCQIFFICGTDAIVDLNHVVS